MNLYVIVRAGATAGQKMAQVAHVTAELVQAAHGGWPTVSARHTSDYGLWVQNPVVVVLQTIELAKVIRTVRERTVREKDSGALCAAFFEPHYDYALTAFAVLVPVTSAEYLGFDKLERAS